MSILPTLQPLIFTQTESVVTTTTTTQQQQLEKLQQQENLKTKTQQQQQHHHHHHHHHQQVTRTPSIPTYIPSSPSPFDAQYSSIFNTNETIDLILEDFSEVQTLDDHHHSASSSHKVPVFEETEVNESKESAFSHPKTLFYETNTELHYLFDSDMFVEQSSNPINLSTNNLSDTTTITTNPVLTVLTVNATSITSIVSPSSVSREVTFSPSPSPSPYSSSSSSASTTTFLRGTVSNSSTTTKKVKKNRGTPPKPKENASKEEMEKYLDIRSKNNVAAYTSRKKKKEKEEENIKRLEFLKKENEQLRILLEQCKKEATSLHDDLQKLIKNFKKD